MGKINSLLVSFSLVLIHITSCNSQENKKINLLGNWYGEDSSGYYIELYFYELHGDTLVSTHSEDFGAGPSFKYFVNDDTLIVRRENVNLWDLKYIIEYKNGILFLHKLNGYSLKLERLNETIDFRKSKKTQSEIYEKFQDRLIRYYRDKRK